MTVPRFRMRTCSTSHIDILGLGRVLHRTLDTGCAGDNVAHCVWVGIWSMITECRVGTTVIAWHLIGTTCHWPFVCPRGGNRLGNHHWRCWLPAKHCRSEPRALSQPLFLTPASDPSGYPPCHSVLTDRTEHVWLWLWVQLTSNSWGVHHNKQHKVCFMCFTFSFISCFLPVRVGWSTDQMQFIIQNNSQVTDSVKLITDDSCLAISSNSQLI